MRIVNDSDTRESLKRGKSFGDLVDEEKVQEFMGNFYHAYNSFYDSNLGKHWCKRLELSNEFINDYRERRKKIRKNFYKTVLLDDKFRSSLYKTVEAWVSNAPFGGCKLKSSSNFFKIIEKIADDLEQMREITLESLVEKKTNFSQTEQMLKSIFERLETADQTAQLVSNGKTLFHLLPDLIMPVDRAHVLDFFIGWRKANSPISRKKEIEYFIGIFKYYYQICKKNFTQIKGIYYKKRGRYDSSVPKIIDNAVCGYTARS